ncbi:hypothetical protein BKK81_05360 [Cupriavidus sp. USMAHM13]|uniref:hypothetical protein n=1 Tax=Cupriavidus sp. USMAHM13 TaxID=1389192 RepID=UPI0008A712A7|nr:hypothetical protein [Cupriavidus sp. USMAHM13]AOY98771.1 hypothetical protein BKK81_05360 [Cupriavidus sp. USMAHM13]
MLHVRVPVRMLDQLETLQFVTKRKTSDVVRASLDMYIQANGEVLIAVAKARGGWPKESPQPGSVPLSFTREELEAAEEVAKQDEQDAG